MGERFHSINVPSEWGPSFQRMVSLRQEGTDCFHSINVPSEWGLNGDGHQKMLQNVSIQLMSPASGDILIDLSLSLEDQFDSFHSINVPSEWGLTRASRRSGTSRVSIQLMSPASGDNNGNNNNSRCVYLVSIQLMSPASGDKLCLKYRMNKRWMP